MPDGFVDLHCHLLYGLDDGAKTVEDTVQMAEALVELGYSDVAPSPHARAEYASQAAAEARLRELAELFIKRNIPLKLHPNAENFFLEPGFLESEKPRALGAGRYVLVEAPYTAVLPMLPQTIFRMKVKGRTPLIAHPERCLEFEKKDRAREAVDAGALLQLDMGALIGRYGGTAKKVARRILDDGLYAVAATDLHGPVGARDWVGKSLAELRSRAGEAAFTALVRDHPRMLLRGEPMER